MKKIKIIADDGIPFLKGVLEPVADIAYLPSKQIDRETIQKADALIIRTRTKCNAALLEGSRVKFIGTATIGYDHIDTEYCNSRNIRWINAPGCNASSVNQYMLAALLELAENRSIDLRNSTLGIIGAGNVGSKIVATAELLGMKVLVNDPPRARMEGHTNFCGLEEVLRMSDIITLHVPLIKSGIDRTYHMIDEGEIEKMKQGAWLINTSRGEVVNTQAIKSALSANHLAGVILDVWENEPRIDQDLLNCSYIATPHIAGYSGDGKRNGTSMVVRSLCDFFNLPTEEIKINQPAQPEFPEITLDATGKSDLVLLLECVRHSYNIMIDDSRLRSSPATFEEQRKNYPARREFPAFTVKIHGYLNKDIAVIEKAGFNLKLPFKN